MDAVKAAGIGRTPQLCQDALIEMLEELFTGKKYNGQQGRKPLKIYKQDLPVPEDYDADVDTDAAAAPYIVARMTGGAIKDESGPQTVEFSLIVFTPRRRGAARPPTRRIAGTSTRPARVCASAVTMAGTGATGCSM